MPLLPYVALCVRCVQNYWLAFLSKVIGDCLAFVQPMLLQLLLASLATQTFTYCMTAAFAMVRHSLTHSVSTCSLRNHRNSCSVRCVLCRSIRQFLAGTLSTLTCNLYWRVTVSGA